MLIFNCSKAASDFFSITRKGVKVSPVAAAPCNLLSDDIKHIKNDDGNTPAELNEWLIHVVRVQCKPIVFAIEQNTRYIMTFVDLKKGDVQLFITDFIERLANMIQYSGEDLMVMNNRTFEPMISKFLEANNEYRFYDRSDKSMQSHINDVSWHFKHTAQSANCLPTAEQAMYFDRGINHMPKTYKGLTEILWPEEAMLYHWLKNYCGHSDAQISEIKKCR
ncbi:DUF6933 domain-containing protein [Vibrio scophthalmi]|uniref:DUF6933 domain-containing protein n=1 Tax=Vibrio scophthalmi TaxID=45658 RepID=A0A1E3WLF9_9VIBR|nr:hypothetical protein [Vibrio scophthalmi]ODS10611.1 hypothetical protein VSF3289_00870 [Vibrio scophthalmi]